MSSSAKYIWYIVKLLDVHQWGSMPIYICDQSWGYKMDWWAHQSHDLSQICQFALKDCGPCCTDTGSKGHRVASYPVSLQATKAD